MMTVDTVLEQELRVLHLDQQAAGRRVWATGPGLSWNLQTLPQWHFSSKATVLILLNTSPSYEPMGSTFIQTTTLLIKFIFKVWTIHWVFVIIHTFLPSTPPSFLSFPILTVVQSRSLLTSANLNSCSLYSSTCLDCIALNFSMVLFFPNHNSAHMFFFIVNLYSLSITMT